MKRSVLVAVAALAAAAAIGAGGAASASGLSERSNQAELSAKALGALKGRDDNDFHCTSDGVELPNTATIPGDQTCVITGSTRTCIEKTDSATAVQKCLFTQTTGVVNKHAKALQIAATDKGPSPQRHAQIVTIEQLSVAASNDVDVTQSVKQSLGRGHYDDTDEEEPESVSTTSPTIVTQQDFRQIVTVEQTTGTGNNDSAISQFAKQRARAKQALSISQHQNTLLPEPDEVCPAQDENANMCSLVRQTSGSGQNRSTLNDTYLQFERAHKTTAGDQQQGVAGTGGIDHEIHQQSSGLCKIVTNQSERQTMRAVQASVAQNQHGPTRKGAGSEQACSDDSVWTGTQDSKQVATSRPREEDIGSLVFAASAVQTNLLEYFGVSAGSINATQSVTQQNNAGKTTTPNSCSGNVCGAVISCAEGFCSSSQDPNPCGPGEFPNPVTGRCDNID